MSYEELRVEALRLANGFNEAPEDAVRRARLYLDFLMGTDRTALADEAKAAIDRLMA